MSDYDNLDEKGFEEALPDVVYDEIVPYVKKHNAECFVLGGFVRDWLLGAYHPSTFRDVDIYVIGIDRDDSFLRREEWKRRGLDLKIRNEYDIRSYKRSVDFTINAGFYDLINHYFINPETVLDDKGVLRTIGNVNHVRALRGLIHIHTVNVTPSDELWQEMKFYIDRVAISRMRMSSHRLYRFYKKSLDKSLPFKVWQKHGLMRNLYTTGTFNAERCISDDVPYGVNFALGLDIDTSDMDRYYENELAYHCWRWEDIDMILSTLHIKHLNFDKARRILQTYENGLYERIIDTVKPL